MQRLDTIKYIMTFKIMSEDGYIQGWSGPGIWAGKSTTFKKFGNFSK